MTNKIGKYYFSYFFKVMFSWSTEDSVKRKTCKKRYYTYENDFKMVVEFEVAV